MWLPLASFSLLGMCHICVEMEDLCGIYVSDLDLDAFSDEIVRNFIGVQRGNREGLVSDVQAFWKPQHWLNVSIFKIITTNFNHTYKVEGMRLILVTYMPKCEVRGDNFQFHAPGVKKLCHEMYCVVVGRSWACEMGMILALTGKVFFQRRRAHLKNC